MAEEGTPDIDMLLRTQLEMFRGMISDMMSLRTTVKGMTADLNKMGKAERVHFEKLLKDLEYAANAQKGMAENMLEYATRPKVPLPLDVGAEIGKLLEIHKKVLQSGEAELAARERLSQIAKDAAERSKAGATKSRGAINPLTDEIIPSPETTLSDVKRKYGGEADSEMARLQEESFRRMFDDILATALEPIVTLLTKMTEMSAMGATPIPSMVGAGSATAASVEADELRETISHLNPFVRATVASFGLLQKASVGLAQGLFGTRDRSGELGATAKAVSTAFGFVSTRVKRASDSYDAFLAGVNRFMTGIKEFFTLQGFLAFAVRSVAIPIFYTANLLKDGVKALWNTNWKELGGKIFAKIGDGFEKVGKAASSLREKFMNGMTAISDGISSFQGTMSSWKTNLKEMGVKSFAKIGDGFERVGKAASSLREKFTNSMTAISNGISSFGGMMSKASSAVLAPLKGFAVSIFTTVIPAVMGFAGSIIGAVIPPLIAFGAAFLAGVVAVATFVGSLIAAAAPFILIGVAIGLVIYGLYLMYQKFEWVRKAVDLYIEGVKMYMSAINDYLIQPLIAAGQAIGDFFGGLWDMFKNTSIGKWLLGDDSKKTTDNMKNTSETAKKMQEERYGASMSDLQKEKQYLDSPEYAREIMKARERGDDDTVMRMSARQRAVALEINRRSQIQASPMTIPEGGRVGNATPIVVVNQANAAPVVSGGGGNGGQAGFVPVRNQNETIKDFQLANIPRG